ncbi:MAG: hypothetical protein ABI361_05970 [Nitrososphaera sp.]
MDFVNPDGSITVPKSVRPLVDLPESLLGNKKGALRQFRQGRLHILEYEDRYSVHMDRVNPEQSPLGHLALDAPEYLAGAYFGWEVGKRVGASVYDHQKRRGKSAADALISGVVAGCLTGACAGGVAHAVANRLKKDVVR